VEAAVVVTVERLNFSLKGRAARTWRALMALDEYESKVELLRAMVFAFAVQKAVAVDVEPEDDDYYATRDREEDDGPAGA
jgi:hypothetical protein